MAQTNRHPSEQPQKLRADGVPLVRPTSSQRMLYPEIIRGRIRELGLSERAVAEAIGLTGSKLSMVFQGKRDFGLFEAMKMADAISIPFTVVIATVEGGFAVAECYSMKVVRT